MIRIALLTEAGSGIGFGHLTRMQALAGALRAAGARVELRVEPGSPADREQPGVPWADWVSGARPAADVVVVDSYRARGERYADLRKDAPLVAIDDFARMPYPADLVVNPGLVTPALYRGHPPPRLLCGAPWILLRAAFAAPRPPARREGVLVTVGGQDAHQLLEPLARLAGEAFAGVEVVAGDEARALHLRRVLPKSIRVRGRLGPLAMRNAMDRRALALTAAGQTLHELAARRCAMIAILTGEDQRHNVAGYAAAGALRQTLRFDQPDLLDRVRDDLDALRHKRERERLAAAAARLVDGRGVQRLAKALLQLASRAKNPFSSSARSD